MKIKLMILFFLAIFSGMAQAEHLRCIAFSPYVDGMNPNWPPHPTPAKIDELMDIVAHRTGFKCVLIYGMLNGLDYAVDAAHARGLKVIGSMWLGNDVVVNNQSISKGIAKAKQFPETLIRLSCGVEVWRYADADKVEPAIQNCVTQVKAAGVTQPLTAIDTWWHWCNKNMPCQARPLHSQLDWIGVNIYPWWENKYSGLYPCTTAAQAADFHIARLATVQARYPGKIVMLTEFGWPAGPDGYSEINERTGDHCGVASETNQRLVITSSIKKLDEADIDFSLFETFRESWKGEGNVGPWWGNCDGYPPYACHGGYGFTRFLYLPLIIR
jgi:exo-beta-1,3-glucanase (GH17 family)